MLDEIDQKILFTLSRDSAQKVDKLAKYLGIPRSTVHNRIKKLEAKGIIKRYIAIIDYEKMDLGLTAIIQIILTDKAVIGEVLKNLIANPRIEAVFTVTGRTDIIVKARFKNAQDIGGFNYDYSADNLRSVLGISRTETAIVMHTFKEYSIAENAEPYINKNNKKVGKEKLTRINSV